MTYDQILSGNALSSSKILARLEIKVACIFFIVYRT